MNHNYIERHVDLTDLRTGCDADKDRPPVGFLSRAWDIDECSELLAEYNPVALASVDLGKFTYEDGSDSQFAEYKILGHWDDCEVSVFLFHGSVRMYGRGGKCIPLPLGLVSAMGVPKDLAFVQLFSYGDEKMGPVYSFHRFIRRNGKVLCVPLPSPVDDYEDGRNWTVAITWLDRVVSTQYDGFVYPFMLDIGDPLCVAAYLSTAVKV